MEIPYNNADTTADVVEMFVEKCIQQLKDNGRASLSWRDTSRSIAKQVARKFIERGYHAYEYITRFNGWSFTEVVTYIPEDTSAPMSYTQVIG